MTLVEQAYKALRKYHEMALSAGYDIEEPELRFNLKGARAGTAQQFSSVSKRGVINLNMYFLRNYSEDMLHDTIPHEMAHLMAPWKEGHGRIWKRIMREVFGLDPKRCHNYEAPHIYKHRYGARPALGSSC